MKRRRIVLAGGGHSHALVLRHWAMQRDSDTEIVLVSDASYAPYSGLLPAYVAGSCSHETMHIDLRRLAQAAGAIYIDATVEGLALDQRQLILAPSPASDPRVKVPPLHFDILSINVGSRPHFHEVPGAARWAVPVKPVGPFLEAWDACVEQEAPLRIAIVGGGAGGIELAFAMQERCRGRFAITLLHAGAQLLPQNSTGVDRRLRALLEKRGIRLHLKARVNEVRAEGLQLETGEFLAQDRIFWVTDAAPSPWFAASGLKLDAKGFLLVEETLACSGQSTIFAAGDCASIIAQPRPKAGVFAVRQAPVLASNLRLAAQGKALQKVRLQKRYLALIGTGGGEALALRGSWHAHGKIWWRLKQKIDLKFMQKFSSLPLAMAGPSSMPSDPAEALRCHGCGAKVGGDVLSATLDRISALYPQVLSAPGLTWGLAAREDVSLWQPQAGQMVLQSLDYFPSLVDDPFTAGRIACQHAFSDIVAKGARPHSALLLAVLELAATSLQKDHLFRLLAGIAHELQILGAALSGGHTAEGPQFALGLSVTGVAEGKLLSKVGGCAGDRLVLTKALGSGLIFAGAMQGKAPAPWVDAALARMVHFDPGLFDLLQDPSVHGATDITGFGLIGHLLEMLRGGTLRASLQTHAIPAYEGALALAASGLASSLYPANSLYEASLQRGTIPQKYWSLWGDPQTAGGLLLALAPQRAAAWVEECQKLGYRDAAIIGSLEEGRKDEALIRFS